MTAKRVFKSDAFEAIHASASALRRVGAIDKATMREFDESCLSVPTPLEPWQIKRLRESHVKGAKLWVGAAAYQSGACFRDFQT